MALPNSSLLRFMKGRRLPGAAQSPIETIKKQGDKRVVTLRNGTQLTYSKEALLEEFNKQLTEQQKKFALKSIRVLKGNVVKATIGGAQQGERKAYKSIAGAEYAINRYYERKNGKA